MLLFFSFCSGGCITTVKALVTRMLGGLVWVFPEVDPEIRMWWQTIYLEGVLAEGAGKKSKEMKASTNKCCVEPIVIVWGWH